LRVFPDLREAARSVATGNAAVEIKKLVAAVYDEVRCGLYHRMATKSLVVISRTKMRVTLALRDGVLSAVVIDRRAFLEAISNHLVAFPDELRNNR